MEAITLPRQMGLWVREVRIRQGLSQRELAHRAGVSERLVLSLELGDAPGIQLNKLMAVTQALGMRLLVDLPGEPVPSAPEPAPERVREPESHDDQACKANTTDDPLALYRQLYDEVAETTTEGEEP